MMVQIATVLMGYTVGGVQFQAAESRTAPGSIIHVVDLPAGVQGTMLGLPTTWEFPSGHDFVVGDIVDVHWYDAQTFQFGMVARGYTVTGVDDDTIDLAGSPEGDTSVPELAKGVVTKQIVVDTILDPTLLVLVAIGATPNQSMIDIRDSSISLHAQKLSKRESGWFWIDDWSFDNPLLGGGDIVTVNLSNGTTSRGVAFIVFHYESVVP